jgi:hypothetical protein
MVSFCNCCTTSDEYIYSDIGIKVLNSDTYANDPPYPITLSFIRGGNTSLKAGDRLGSYGSRDVVISDLFSICQSFFDGYEYIGGAWYLPTWNLSYCGVVGDVEYPMSIQQYNSCLCAGPKEWIRTQVVTGRAVVFHAFFKKKKYA